MHLLCVIPARLGSTRLAAKPLRLLAGQPLIRVVSQRVLDLDLDARVVVATDDRRVADAVSGLDVETLLTDPALRSGTERTAAVVEHSAYRAHDLIVNVQGDEPLIEREAVLGAIERVTREGYDIGTAAGPLARGQLANPNRVKVAVDGRGRAVAFFRTPRAPACARRDPVLQHLGVYAYRPRALRRWVGLPPDAAEEREGLEQLRPLAHGLTIGVALLETPAAVGVDTQADLDEVERRLTAIPIPGFGPGRFGGVG